MYDVIIVGKGPAGISAALYTIRANLNTLIIGHGEGALHKAAAIDNYYGLSASVNGSTLHQNGIKQVENLGGSIISDEVIDVVYEDYFVVKTSLASYTAHAVLIATGSPPIQVAIKGLSAFEGRGVSYCAVCDGFFHRGKPVGVVGYNNYGLHEAEILLPLAKNVNLLTHGNEVAADAHLSEIAERLIVNKVKIREVYGSDILEGVVLENGDIIPLSALFIAYGTASGASFALKLGLEMRGHAIITDDSMKTNIPGLFAAGDVAGGFKQVSVAVGQGALAGKSIIEYVRKSARRQ